MKKNDNPNFKFPKKKNVDGVLIEVNRVYDLVVPGLTEEQRGDFIHCFTDVMSRYCPDICFKETKDRNKFKIFCMDDTDDLLHNCVADFFMDSNNEPYELKYAVEDSFALFGLKAEHPCDKPKAKLKPKLKFRKNKKGITITDLSPDYFIDWSRLDSSGKLLDWILHFLEKDMDQMKIYEFAHLVNDHFNGSLIHFGS